MKKKLNLFSVLMLLSGIVLLAGCNPNVDTHEHTFATTYTSNATHHWYAATCEHNDQVKDKAEHNFGEWIITEYPSETAEGTKEKECLECHYKATETIAKLTPTGEPELAIEDYLKFNTIELTDYDYLANVTISPNKGIWYKFGIPRTTLTIETLDGQLLYENTTAFGGYKYMYVPELWGYAFEFYCKEDSGIYYTQRIRTTPEKTNELKITFRYQGYSQEEVIEVSVEDGTWKYIN